MTTGNFLTLQGIRSLAESMGCCIGFSEDVSPLKMPLRAGELNFPNRVAIQPMEGADATPEGEPTAFTKERYLKYAEGGAGLIWFEACAVDFAEAKTHDSMLVISEETLPKFRKLVDEVKKASEASVSKLGMDHRALLVLQLSHAGRYRDEKSDRSPALAYRFPELDRNIGVSERTGRVVSDEELETLTEVFVDAARLAVKAGFDAVDVKACHGYLLNSLLSGFTRGGDYGGEGFEKRSRFLLETIAAIRKEVGCAVTSRFSAYDGLPYPYGFGASGRVGEWISPYKKLPELDLSEPILLLQRMKALGVDLVNVSMGDPYYGPFVTRPFDVKVPGSRDPMEHPLKSVDRHFQVAERLKREIPGMIFVGSGYSWLRQFGVNAASYNIENHRTDIAGWGRLALSFPEFPRTVFSTGVVPRDKACTTCSGCTRLLRARLRTGCVVQNPETFRESMRRLGEMGR